MFYQSYIWSIFETISNWDAYIVSPLRFEKETFDYKSYLTRLHKIVSGYTEH